MLTQGRDKETNVLTEYLESMALALGTVLVTIDGIHLGKSYLAHVEVLLKEVILE